MDEMECIREGEEDETDAEAGDEEGSGRNVHEELANMASSLMAAAQSHQHHEEEEEDEEEEEEEEENNDSGKAAAAVKPVVKRARKLLFRRLRVGVEDGRVFVGKFQCLDKQGNIILYDTMEFRQISPPPVSSSHAEDSSSASKSSSSAAAADGAMEQRSLGLVLIPARCRTSCFVECSLHDQFSLLSI